MLSSVQDLLIKVGLWWQEMPHKDLGTHDITGKPGLRGCETCNLGFPAGRDSATFGTKGQKFLHCPGTKGQAQNLAAG